MSKRPTDNLLVEMFQDHDAWNKWLAVNHEKSSGLWLRFAKKASALKSVSHAEALSTALCYGWIDGQTDIYNEESWLQKFTPRRARSIWSKVNCTAAEDLIANKQMKSAGLKEVERAQQDGRWQAAYDSAKESKVPPDLQAALDQNKKANDFFATLNSKNRYAVLFRIQTVKRTETRAKRIQQFVAMLERHEKIYP